MPTRLSRVLLRVFPAILLIIVGLLAALFRSRRGPRKPDALRSGSQGMPQSPPSDRVTVEGADEASTKIVSVDAQKDGRLYVSGQAPAGAIERLYLNDILVAPARVGRDGTVTFTIGRGVKPGAYKVRLDQVDAASGKVRNSVEVTLSVPDAVRIAGTNRSVAAPSETTPDKDGGGKVASNVSQRRTYGEGDRYTAIYDANQDQIRDPDLIYPDQVFVLPSGHAVEAGWDDKRN